MPRYGWIAGEELWHLDILGACLEKRAKPDAA